MPKLIPTQTAEALIYAVQNRECLYNTNDPAYRNRHTTELAWKDVADEMGRDVADCKTMWSSLRSTFNRNLARQLPGGEGVPDTETCKWPYFKQMLFLKEHVSNGPSINMNTSHDFRNLIVSDIDDEEELPLPFKTETESTTTMQLRFDENEAVAESSDNSICASTSGGSKGKKRKASSPDPIQQAFIEFIDHKRQPQQEEKHLLFFKSLIPYIELLSPTQQLDYMQQILKILMDKVEENSNK